MQEARGPVLTWEMYWGEQWNAIIAHLFVLSIVRLCSVKSLSVIYPLCKWGIFFVKILSYQISTWISCNVTMNSQISFVPNPSFLCSDWQNWIKHECSRFLYYTFYSFSSFHINFFCSVTAQTIQTENKHLNFIYFQVWKRTRLSVNMYGINRWPHCIQTVRQKKISAFYLWLFLALCCLRWKSVIFNCID